MEFRFNVNDVFKQPIVEIGHTLIPSGFKGDRRALWDALSKVTDVVNAMGSASAAAQSLSKPITSADRLRNCDQQTLYLLIDPKACNGKGAVTGMLKTGKKGLYVFDRDGHYYQVQSPCILDFYVHESRQRSGLGKHLFEHMLQKEAIKPEQLAIDRPSEKFLGFLTKHYKLSNPIRQMNNYVVYDGFFPQVKKEDQVPVGSGDASKNGANGLQAQIVTSPYGRYGAPRPPCSMGQIIHNQSSAVTPQEPTGTLQDQAKMEYQVPQVPQVQWTNQTNNQQEVCRQNDIVQYANNTISAPDFSAQLYQKVGNGLGLSEGCNIREIEASGNLQNNSQQELYWPFNGAQAYPEMPRCKRVTYPKINIGDLLQPDNFKETSVPPQKSTYNLSGKPIDPNSVVSKESAQFWPQMPSGSDEYNYFAKSIKSATKADQQQINNNVESPGYYITQVYTDPNTNQQQLVYYQVPSQQYISQNNVQYMPMQQINQQQPQPNEQLFTSELQHPNVVYHPKSQQDTYALPYIPQGSNQNTSYMQMNNVESDSNNIQYQQQPRNNEQQYYTSPQQIQPEFQSQAVEQNNAEQKVPPQIVLNQKTGQYHYVIPMEQNHVQQYQDLPTDMQNIVGDGEQQSYNYQQVSNQVPGQKVPNQANVQQMQYQMQPIQNLPIKEQICSVPQPQYVVNQQHQAQAQPMAQNVAAQQQPQNTGINPHTMIVQSTPEPTASSPQVYSTLVQPQLQQGQGQAQQTNPNQSTTSTPEQNMPVQQAYSTPQVMLQPQQAYLVQQNVQPQEGQVQPQQAYLQTKTVPCNHQQTTPSQQVYSSQQAMVQPQQVYSVQQNVQPQEGQMQLQQAYPQTKTVPCNHQQTTPSQQVYSSQQAMVQPQQVYSVQQNVQPQEGQMQPQQAYPQTKTVPCTPQQTTLSQQAYSPQQIPVQLSQAYSNQQNVSHQPQGQPQQTHHIVQQNQYSTPSYSEKTILTKEQSIKVPQINSNQQNYSVPQSYKQMQMPTNYTSQYKPQNNNNEVSNVTWTEPVNYPTYQQPQYVQSPQYTKQMPAMDGAGDKRLESDMFLNKIYMEPLIPIENLPKHYVSSPKIECPNLLRSLSKRSDIVARQSSKVCESQKRHQKSAHRNMQLQTSKSLPQNGSQPLFVTKNKIMCKGCIPRS